MTEPRHTFLHVGCGGNRKDKTTLGFASYQCGAKYAWISALLAILISPARRRIYPRSRQIRSMAFFPVTVSNIFTRMKCRSRREFWRVPGGDGFVVIICPDLQAVAKLIADDRLTDRAYTLPSGAAITPLDIVFGHNASEARGQHYMAHKCGLTKTSVMKAFGSTGLRSAVCTAVAFNLWALASKSLGNNAELDELANSHFTVAPALPLRGEFPLMLRM